MQHLSMVSAIYSFECCTLPHSLDTRFLNYGVHYLLTISTNYNVLECIFDTLLFMFGCINMATAVKLKSSPALLHNNHWACKCLFCGVA